MSTRAGETLAAMPGMSAGAPAAEVFPEPELDEDEPPDPLPSDPGANGNEPFPSDPVDPPDPVDGPDPAAGPADTTEGDEEGQATWPTPIPAMTATTRTTVASAVKIRPRGLADGVGAPNAGGGHPKYGG